MSGLPSNSSPSRNECSVPLEGQLLQEIPLKELDETLPEKPPVDLVGQARQALVPDSRPLGRDPL